MVLWAYMIAFIEGIVAYLEEDAVVVSVGGLGYRLFTPRAPSAAGETVRFHIAEVIREDRHDLYGFRTRDELAMFHQLVGIDGVGPKMALKILSAGTIDTLLRNIQAGDVGFLTSISGVGKKTAQKIVLELKGVLVGEAATEGGDVVDALLSLGYSRSDLEAIIPHLTAETVDQKIKQALQMLGKHR